MKHEPEDLEYLVDFRVTGEERIAPHNHLCKNAPHGPHVDSGRVLTGAKQDFGSPIPKCHDLSQFKSKVRIQGKWI